MEQQKDNDSNSYDKIWLTSVMMGLGHMRAANALKDIAKDKIIIDGSEKFSQPEEYKVWKAVRRVYYLLSRAEKIPLIGSQIVRLLSAIQRIPHYYPARDLSAPNLAARYLGNLIRKKNLSASLLKKIKDDDIPLLNTFYATAIAVDVMENKERDNYLLICDTDFNRVWVPENPRESRIKYLAPCTNVERRLISYGVPEDKIFLTGFPLPKENIGCEDTMEILKNDLYNRLVRLDPMHKFFNFHGQIVEYFLERKIEKDRAAGCFTLTFAVGGAGAQSEMVHSILMSLRKKIINGEIKVNLSAGIRKDVFESFNESINSLALKDMIGTGIKLIYSNDIFLYFDEFNKILRDTDVLWTKPSELTFYCALGIPILMAPTVGSHEELNMNWLQDVHAGVNPAGPIEHVDEWLFDLRDSGILAEAAWDGFLKGRKLGSFKIERLVTSGGFSNGVTPLER